MISEVQSQKTPVGVSGFPIIGNLPDFARGPIEFLTGLKEEYGDVASFSLMGEKGVLLGSPQDIDRVFMESGKRYGKFKPTFALRTVLGNGLVTSDGDFWKRQRKLAAPAFHHQSIKQYADQMVAYAQDMVAAWKSGEVRDIHHDMMMLTQRIIMKILFSADVIENADEASEAFNAMMHGLGADMGGIETILPEFIQTPTRREMVDSVNYINRLLMDIIEQRRTEGSDKNDLLTMLIEARDDEDQPMTTKQLLDEIRTLYLAGHETTATTLSWTWHLLSNNPTAYEKLEKEIKGILDGRTPTADDVQNLPYANAVIKESLRCYPVAWVTQRIALEDVEIGGYRIEKGTGIWLSPYIVHHDARWYADPESFNPERWLKAKEEQPARETYLPFGGGPRICIGNGLAMMEAVLLLATILQKHHIAVVPDYPVEMELSGTLRPKFGLQATVTAR
jgi:cytochrome P450